MRTNKISRARHLDGRGIWILDLNGPATVSSLPNHAGLFKTMVCREIRTILFEASKLREFLNIEVRTFVFLRSFAARTEKAIVRSRCGVRAHAADLGFDKQLRCKALCVYSFKHCYYYRYYHFNDAQNSTYSLEPSLPKFHPQT